MAKVAYKVILDMILDMLQLGFLFEEYLESHGVPQKKMEFENVEMVPFSDWLEECGETRLSELVRDKAGLNNHSRIE